jgi:hypothetical protein
MTMFDTKPYTLLVGLIVLVLFTRPTHAFGAGNIAGISKLEGQNCTYSSLHIPSDSYLELLAGAEG